MLNATLPKRCLIFLLGTLMAQHAVTSPAQWQSGNIDMDKARALHSANARFKSDTQPEMAQLSLLSRVHRQHQRHNPYVATLYAKAGLPDLAEPQLANTDTPPEVALAIARAYYAAGNYRAAEKHLLRLPPNLPAKLSQARAALLTRCLLHQNRFDEAALPLAALETVTELSATNRYNLGIAWLGAGAGARGAGELDDLGRYSGDNLRLQALADQANLALAFWLLEHQRPNPARQALWRIPLTSPLARKGLLALGWAEFLDSDAKQPVLKTARNACLASSTELWDNAAPLHQVPRNRCRVTQVDRKPGLLAATGYAEESNKFARAALAWKAASADGDARNPVVAEALITLPFALLKAGDAAAAQRSYQYAITQLLAADERLSQAPINTDIPITRTPAHHMQALEATLTGLRQHLRERVAPLAADSQNRNAQDVKRILENLRQQAPAGRSMAQPSALQRGRLLLALSSAQNSQTVRAFNDRSRAAFQTRIDQLDARIGQAQDQLNAYALDLQQQQIAAQQARIQTYLRQAALAFADLAQTAPDQN